jgi:hypothetical protein
MSPRNTGYFSFEKGKKIFIIKKEAQNEKIYSIMREIRDRKKRP